MRTLTFLLCLVASAALAQEPSTKSIQYDLSNVKAVKLRLPGRITLSNSENRSLQFDYKVSASGKVWGLSSKRDVITYEPNIKLIKDTLVISVKTESFWMIGFSTYKEEFDQQLYL